MNNLIVGIQMIKNFEQLRLKAYADAIYGWKVPTIGYGCTYYPNGSKVGRGDVITEEQAEVAFDYLIEKDFLPQLQKIPTWDQMNSNQQSAMLCFAWNIGANFYHTKNHESITKVCDSPDMWSNAPWVIKQFVKYRNDGNPVEDALLGRRIEEGVLFCTQVA